MTIRWIGQSGYVLKTANTEIIIDPYLSDAVNRIAKRPRMVPTPIEPADIRADAVVCTHNHLDHLDVDAISAMRDSQYFITTAEGVTVLNGMGKNNAVALAEGNSINVGDMKLTAVYSHHTVEAFGLIVEAEHKTLYFSGDTLFDEKLFGIADYRPDYTFICINGRLGNMNVNEALLTAEKIGAKVNIPNHYGMFASNTEDPHKFADNIAGGCILEFDKVYSIENIK
ncbi:MAG: MBL fold metallo-hydrolase [Eubacteriales bacterium]